MHKPQTKLSRVSRGKDLMQRDPVVPASRASNPASTSSSSGRPLYVALTKVATVARKHQRSRQVYCFTKVSPQGSQNHGTVRVSFAVPYRCYYGQHICVVGSEDRLGGWDVKRGLPMEWTDGDIWTADMELHPREGMLLEYKYVVRDGDGGVVCWKPGENCSLSLSHGVESFEQAAGQLKVNDTWDGSVHAVEVLVAAARAARRSGVSLLEAQPVSAHDPDDDVAVVARAAEKAMRELDVAIMDSMELLDSIDDPAHPQVLAADRLVAAKASRAVTLMKALKAADPPRGAKLLRAAGQSLEGETENQ